MHKHRSIRKKTTTKHFDHIAKTLGTHMGI